jgi:hypothetical protein
VCYTAAGYRVLSPHDESLCEVPRCLFVANLGISLRDYERAQIDCLPLYLSRFASAKDPEIVMRNNDGV